MRKKNDTESADIIKELYVEDKRLEKYGENCVKTAYEHSERHTGTKKVTQTLLRSIKAYKKTGKIQAKNIKKLQKISTVTQKVNSAGKI